MTMAALVSGLYLVGREDGTVEPVLVRLRLRRTGDCDVEGHQHHVAIACHALKQPGWWWRRMVVPSVLPLDLDGPPSVNRLPEGD